MAAPLNVSRRHRNLSRPMSRRLMQASWCSMRCAPERARHRVLLVRAAASRICQRAAPVTTRPRCICWRFTKKPATTSGFQGDAGGRGEPPGAKLPWRDEPLSPPLHRHSLIGPRIGSSAPPRDRRDHECRSRGRGAWTSTSARIRLLQSASSSCTSTAADRGTRGLVFDEIARQMVRTVLAHYRLVRQRPPLDSISLCGGIR